MSITFHKLNLETIDDGTFNSFIENSTVLIEQANIDAQKQKEQAEKERQEFEAKRIEIELIEKNLLEEMSAIHLSRKKELLNAGAIFNDITGEFTYNGNLIIYWHDLVVSTSKEWLDVSETLISQIGKLKTSTPKKAAKKVVGQTKEEKDNEQLKIYIKALLAVECGEMLTNAYKAEVNEIRNDLRAYVY